jgi:ankyrin repeat protein
MDTFQNELTQSKLEELMVSKLTCDIESKKMIATKIIKNLNINNMNVNNYVNMPNQITYLMEAANQDNLGVLLALIELKDSLNLKIDLFEHFNRWTALIYAIHKNNYRCVKALLEANASPSICNPLLKAASIGNVSCIKLLCEYSADINSNDIVMNNALSFAAKNGHIDCVNYLIDNKCNFEIDNINDETPLMLATLEGHFKCVEALLKCGANPNKCNKDNISIILLAVESKNIDCVKELLNSNKITHKNINIKSNIDGNTPLISAVIDENITIVNMLLEYGVKVNIKNHDKKTAMDYAIIYNNFDIVKLLLKYNAVIPEELITTQLSKIIEDHKNEMKEKNQEHHDKPAKNFEVGYTKKMNGYIYIVKKNRIGVKRWQVIRH